MLWTLIRRTTLARLRHAVEDLTAALLRSQRQVADLEARLADCDSRRLASCQACELALKVAEELMAESSRPCGQKRGSKLVN